MDFASEQVAASSKAFPMREVEKIIVLTVRLLQTGRDPAAERYAWLQLLLLGECR